MQGKIAIRHFSGPEVFLSPVEYLLVEVSVICTHILMYHLIESIIIMGTFAVLAMTFSYVRCNQMVRFTSPYPAHFTSTQISQFLHLNGVSLRILANTNAIYGNALAVFLMMGIPTSAIDLLLLLLFTSSSLSMTLIRFILFTFLSFGDFGVHFNAILLFLKFHKPVKRMIQVYYRHGNLHLSLKLKLVRYIELFTLNNRFLRPNTFNYGSFGNIQFRSFGKVSLARCCLIYLYKLYFLQHIFWYIKIVLFAYKFINQIHK